MTGLTDVMLENPLPELWAQALLFFGFLLHLTLVLVMIGTALLGVYFFIEALWGRDLNEDDRWDKRILGSFLGVKALAVVIGVAPLLVIQTAYGIPFLTATNLNAPVWLLIIGLLVVAFLSFDALSHRIHVHRYLHLFFGIVALIALLVVPAIFVATLVMAENPDAWAEMMRQGSFPAGRLGWFWLLRYLHILGASVVLGAAFHYWFSTEDDPEKRTRLLRWLIAGLLFQIPVGVMLYGFLPHGASTAEDILVMIGVVVALTLLWLIIGHISRERTLRHGVAFTGIMLIILPMLLTRQWHQNRTFLPLQRALEEKRETYRKTLSPYRRTALASYQDVLDHPVVDGQTIYERSCAFCHGLRGDGAGGSASELEVPPAVLAGVRTDRDYLHRILMSGVDGTGMPRFQYYDASARQRAEKVWSETCKKCHGKNGSGSPMSAPYRPPPPDLTRWFPGPERTFEVITQGYPGTMMPAFRQLPEDVRWGLVDVVRSKYRSPSAAR